MLLPAGAHATRCHGENCFSMKPTTKVLIELARGSSLAHFSSMSLFGPELLGTKSAPGKMVTGSALPPLLDV